MDNDIRSSKSVNYHIKRNDALVCWCGCFLECHDCRKHSLPSPLLESELPLSVELCCRVLACATSRVPTRDGRTQRDQDPPVA
eukprot:scaffold2117_cov245-Chaetoceros_neogracile.AAC.8